MTEDDIVGYIRATFPEIETSQNFGYTFFFYKGDHKRPFASLSASDNEYDRYSDLDRPGIFRLNLGVGKPTFQVLFGSAPIDLTQYDFTALDRFFPHPEYSAFHFISILNPSETTFNQLRSMLFEAYNLARERNAEK